MGEARVYPFGGAFSHVVGYVAKVTADDLAKDGRRTPTRSCSPPRLPHRQAGGGEGAGPGRCAASPAPRRSRSTASGRVIREDPAGDIPATPGKEVVLTPGRRHPEPRAGGVRRRKSGAAVMMDVRNGDVLCLLSAPRLRRQPVRHRRRRRRTTRALADLRPQAAAGQGAERHLPARLDLQDHGGAGGAGERRSTRAAPTPATASSRSATTCSSATSTTARWTCTGRSSPRATSSSTRPR